MSKKITKAIIPAAGLGTRMLPFTKTVPKEMLPIGNKPVIQYIVEEAVESGITDILIITNRGKEIIENYFDRSPELELMLSEKGNVEDLNEIKKISSLANIYFIRQKTTKGLGHAIGCAQNFVGADDFLVLYPDDLLISNIPVSKKLIELQNEFKLGGAICVQKFPQEEICNYSSIKIKKETNKNVFLCDDMIEKPDKDKMFSDFAIIGRCVLTSEIFGTIKKLSPGYGGEIQLTDAMKIIAQKNGIVAFNFEGKRFDIGNKNGFINAVSFCFSDLF